MVSSQSTGFGRYLVYPNEPIDKLTVNRTFERLFEDIEKKTASAQLSLSAATERRYGKAKFSSLTSFYFEEPSGEGASDYGGSMLTISQIGDMSRRMTGGDTSALFASPLTSDTDSVQLTGNAYWVRSEYARTGYQFMPNGVNVVTCSFDLGFNGLADALSDTSIAEHDLISPVAMSGYGDVVNIDTESYWNISDFASEAQVTDTENPSGAWRLVDMDGKRLDIPFAETAYATLRHNRCPSTIYSAYMQSYVEMTLTMRISVRSLFEQSYGERTYEMLGGDSETVGTSSVPSHGIGREFRLFTQKPVVMAQIGFFNNDSNPKLLMGFDNSLSGGSEYRFYNHSRISQKPLDEVDTDGSMTSPVNGCVFVRDISNAYDADGNITDNMLTLHVVMKFMAGSPSDPEMEYALKMLNSRSRVQLAMIGV